MIYWFTSDWWRYLCAKPFSFRAFICRARGHPKGIVYDNPGGWEPDFHCVTCGDDLG